MRETWLGVREQGVLRSFNDAVAAANSQRPLSDFESFAVDMVRRGRTSANEAWNDACHAALAGLTGAATRLARPRPLEGRAEQA